MDSIIKEACVEGYQEAMLAEKLGADRIELCSHLDRDGLTPERETIIDVLRSISIPIKIMIFIYKYKTCINVSCKTMIVSLFCFSNIIPKTNLDIIWKSCLEERDIG